MPVPFKVIKQEPESIYDRKVILEMSEADYLALRHYANYYADAQVAAAAACAAAARFANGTPEGYYTLDYSKLFGGEVSPLNATENADVRAGRVISAIKSYRTRNPSVSLKEAKDIVDAYKATMYRF